MPIEAVIYLKRYDLKNEQRWKRDATRWRVCLSVRPSVCPYAIYRMVSFPTTSTDPDLTLESCLRILERN